MRKKIKSFIIYIMILFLIVAFLDSSKIFADEIEKIDEENKSVYTLQLEERAKLLKEALNEFAATSKEQAINIYAKGVKKRSGPMQYSVMSKKLKNQFEKEMIESKNYAWVTGVSSPWVTDYKIMKLQKISRNEYKVTVAFFLDTSSGAFKTEKIVLTINQKNNRWYITDIKEEID